MTPANSTDTHLRHTAYDRQARAALRSTLWSIPSRKRIPFRERRAQRHTASGRRRDPMTPPGRPRGLDHRVEKRAIDARSTEHWLVRVDAVGLLIVESRSRCGNG